MKERIISKNQGAIEGLKNVIVKEMGVVKKLNEEMLRTRKSMVGLGKS